MYAQQQQNTAAGAVFGEYGVENPDSIFLLGTDTQSIHYFAGWLGVSVLPVVDAPADVRDCLVQNDKLVWNGVDCGGATVSTISSLAAFGVVTTGPAVGADLVEDVTDVVSITRKFATHTPASKLDDLAGFLYKFPKKLLDEAASRADGKVFKVIKRAQLRKAGFSSEQVNTLIKNEAEVTDALSRAKKLSDDGVSPETVVDVSRTGGEVSQTQIAVRRGEDVIWLEKGTTEKGWQHIIDRHPEFYDMKGMSSEDNIQKAIQQTVENGRRTPLEDSRGGYAYEYKPNGDQTMTVFVAENGYIFTARPGGLN
jgi:hypothetical protein